MKLYTDSICFDFQIGTIKYLLVRVMVKVDDYLLGSYFKSDTFPIYSYNVEMWIKRFNGLPGLKREIVSD